MIKGTTSFVVLLPHPNNNSTEPRMNEELKDDNETLKELLGEKSENEMPTDDINELLR